MTEPPRYGVGETGGGLTARAGSGNADHVTVFVFDRAYCSRVVAEYRSEDLLDPRQSFGRTLGAAGARQRARAEAARRNRGES